MTVIRQEDEDYLLQGEREAEMMIIEAYAALLLAFLSTERSLLSKQSFIEGYVNSVEICELMISLH